MPLPRQLLAGAAVVVLAASGASSTAAPNTGGDNGASGSSPSVSVNNDYFQPKVDTVAVNTTVSSTWSPGDVDHNVTFQDGPASSTQSSGTYQRAFTAAGTCPYHRTIHQALGMVGTIVVR